NDETYRDEVKAMLAAQRAEREAQEAAETAEDPDYKDKWPFPEIEALGSSPYLVAKAMGMTPLVFHNKFRKKLMTDEDKAKVQETLDLFAANRTAMAQT